MLYGPVLNALGVILANFDNIRITLPKVVLLNQTRSIPTFQKNVTDIYKG